jgi:hypothetical protein
MNSSINISSEFKKIVSSVIISAIKYEKITGRKLGITGEIGEVLVCEKLKLKLLKNSIFPGYDAIDSQGYKYQIKTRRGNTNSPGARMGTFSSHSFNYAILAILDDKYNLVELYKITYKKLEPILKCYEKRNPPLRQFKKIATRIETQGKK